jgi:hypothetical protein
MTVISDELRRAVRERARNCCEYCLLNEEDNFLSHEIDHIIAEKHRGATTQDNLCLSCFECNRRKGSDIASLDTDTNVLTALFHPRHHRWAEHFRLNGVVIEPLTPIGRVTVYLLQMNSDEQVTKRQQLARFGRYPCILANRIP